MHQVTEAYGPGLQTLKADFPHPQAQVTLAKNSAKLAYNVGNLKIGEDTLIFNMGTATDCPSARAGLCDLAHKKHGGNGKCYALKAEAMYPQSKAFRSLQGLQWETWSAARIADSLFSEVAARSHRKTPIRFVRFNEAGDFASLSCVRKAGKIAGYVAELCKRAGLPVVRFYTYTHRSDIFQGPGLAGILASLPRNLVINGSNFKVHNEFRVLPISRAARDAKTETGTKVNKYTCLDDCSKCSLCKVRTTGITIIQAMH
jgi:hypothetical protein